MTKLSVVAVVPAYNEEKTIARILLLSEKYVDKVIVVDDGSSDITGEIAQRLGFETLRLEANKGKGSALRAGIEHAKKIMPFDILVTMDADLQHDPDDIPKIIDPIVKGEADLVIGVRPMDSRIMPRDRIAGNKLLDVISNKQVDPHIHDTQSGFRAYSAKSLTKINFIEDGMATESQTFVDAVSIGLKIVEVPISTTYEGIVPKRSRIGHFSQVLDYLLTRTVADSPLLYLGIPGIAAILLGVIAGVRVVQIFINNHQQIAAGTALISVTLIIIGAVLMATSLMIKLLKIRAFR
jgi:glycosyltransferase involved in cell wall biosynthesis